MMMELERKRLLNVSDMRGTVSGFLFFYYDLVQGFYTMLWVPYEAVLFAYLSREWEDGHRKIRKRGIRGSENKGNKGTGYLLGTRAGPSLLSWVDPSCLTSFMLVFSPRCRYEVGPAVPLACYYSVYAGPDSVCSSSSYHPSHQHLLLNLSPFRYS
jgi:hypothetical protein